MKKTILTFSIIAATGILLSSCGGNVTEVTIGSQVWMSKNLDVSTFRNGDPIPQAKTNEEWQKAGKNRQPAWCYYDNDPANGAKYGKLYNWYAVNDPRGLAPVGYHIPSHAEWIILTDFLGGDRAVRAKMKSTRGWDKHGNGNNSSGFSGLPGGMRTYGYELYFIGFQHLGSGGYWWSSTEKEETGSAWCYYMHARVGPVRHHPTDQREGLSVRCLRD